jgi:kinetochore protein Spc7/SPC105
MKSDISESTAQLDQTEADCLIHNPPVIREYLSAGDEEKKIFEMTFKAFKINTQLRARERWYDWRMGLMERVRPDVEEVYEGMKEDQQRLDGMERQTKALLPELRARQMALREELGRERKVVRELEGCDQGELRELREAINEQG